jgi:hypothetical protein
MASGPPSRSHSQLKTYLECGKRYELEKVHRVPRRPGMWLPAGTAVHRAVERYLISTLTPEGDGDV